MSSSVDIVRFHDDGSRADGAAGALASPADDVATAARNARVLLDDDPVDASIVGCATSVDDRTLFVICVVRLTPALLGSSPTAWPLFKEHKHFVSLNDSLKQRGIHVPNALPTTTHSDSIDSIQRALAAWLPSAIAACASINADVPELRAFLLQDDGDASSGLPPTVIAAGAAAAEAAARAVQNAHVRAPPSPVKKRRTSRKAATSVAPAPPQHSPTPTLKPTPSLAAAMFAPAASFFRRMFGGGKSPTGNDTVARPGPQEDLPTVTSPPAAAPAPALSPAPTDVIPRPATAGAWTEADGAVNQVANMPEPENVPAPAASAATTAAESSILPPGAETSDDDAVAAITSNAGMLADVESSTSSPNASSSGDSPSVKPDSMAAVIKSVISLNDVPLQREERGTRGAASAAARLSPLASLGGRTHSRRGIVHSSIGFTRSPRHAAPEQAPQAYNTLLSMSPRVPVAEAPRSLTHTPATTTSTSAAGVGESESPPRSVPRPGGSARGSPSFTHGTLPSAGMHAIHNLSPRDTSHPLSPPSSLPPLTRVTSRQVVNIDPLGPPALSPLSVSASLLPLLRPKAPRIVMDGAPAARAPPTHVVEASRAPGSFSAASGRTSYMAASSWRQ